MFGGTPFRATEREIGVKSKVLERSWNEVGRQEEWGLIGKGVLREEGRKEMKLE